MNDELIPEDDDEVTAYDMYRAVLELLYQKDAYELASFVDSMWDMLGQHDLIYLLNEQMEQ